MRNMIGVQDILHDHSADSMLPLPQADKIKLLIDDFLVKYQELAFNAETRGDCLYNFPIEFHLL